MEYISQKEYRDRQGVSSSVLKKLLVSEAHLAQVLENGWKKTDATVLGDAMHCFLLEPARFDKEYKIETETYKRATGDFKVGDPKLDEDGTPLQRIVSAEDEIKGEQIKKFFAMVRAYCECPEAQEIIKNRENVEASFFGEYKGQPIKVRCDMMYRDKDGKLWICDIKTVGGLADKPSDPENFSRQMFDFGYDLQCYMYTELIKQQIPDVYGFKFICIDAKIPSGIKIYDIVPGESKWYELGGYRFADAMEKYKHFTSTKIHTTYEKVCESDLNMSMQAAFALSNYREE